MPKLLPRLGLVALAALALSGCSGAKNPLGEPLWSDWGNGSKPVSAYEAEGDSTATGAINPAQPTSGTSYDRWTPIETNGTARLAPLESAPLAPPPGVGVSPAGSGPHAPLSSSAPVSAPVPLASASLPPDPYQSRFIQRTKPLAVTGLGAETAEAAPQKTITQRTLPLVVAGQGTDRGAGSN